MAEGIGPTRESLAWNPGRQTVHADVPAPDEVLLEPAFWSLFSVGGFITAFLLPVTLFLLFFAPPFHLWPVDPPAYPPFLAHWKEPLVHRFFFVPIGGPLFHGVRRLIFLSQESRVKG